MWFLITYARRRLCLRRASKVISLAIKQSFIEKNEPVIHF
jgi:hypothetical protein